MFVIDWDIRCVVFWLDEMRGGKVVVKRSRVSKANERQKTHSKTNNTTFRLAQLFSAPHISSIRTGTAWSR